MSLVSDVFKCFLRGQCNLNYDRFRWFVLGKSEIDKQTTDLSAPFPTPGMAGGLFSIDRSYFYEVGAYDPNMKVSVLCHNIAEETL